MLKFMPALNQFVHLIVKEQAGTSRRSILQVKYSNSIIQTKKIVVKIITSRERMLILKV